VSPNESGRHWRVWIDATLSPPDGSTFCEAHHRVVHFSLRDHIVARANCSGDRFGGAKSLSPSRRTTGVSIADFKRPLRTSHQSRVIQDSRERPNTLLEHVWKNCRLDGEPSGIRT